MNNLGSILRGKIMDDINSNDRLDGLREDQDNNY